MGKLPDIARLRRVLTASILVVAGLLVARALLIRTGVLHPASKPFAPLTLLPVLMPTFCWWAWIDGWLLRRASWRCSAWLRGLLAIYALGMVAPVLVLGWHAYDALPGSVLTWLMFWHAFGPALSLAFIVAGSMKPGRGGMPVNAQEPPSPSPDEPASILLTRRSLLTGAAALSPAIAIGGMAALADRQHRGQFLVRRITMRLPGLPSRLRGLTITHVSDLHLGHFYRVEHLPRLVDTVNRLGSDLIAITGDCVDHDFGLMPAACDAFRQMQSRYGRFVVMGNHDLISEPDRAIACVREQAPLLLLDEHRSIEIGGEHVRIVGLHWSRHDETKKGVPGHRERVRRVLAGADPAMFSLALAHHPHAFDPLADAGVDLTLAGHTHGGQMLLTPPGGMCPLGIGSLMFRYVWGEYRRGRSALYVTSGVGNWWPLRLNCPPEIVQIQVL